MSNARSTGNVAVRDPLVLTQGVTTLMDVDVTSAAGSLAAGDSSYRSRRHKVKIRETDIIGEVRCTSRSVDQLNCCWIEAWDWHIYHRDFDADNRIL